MNRNDQSSQDLTMPRYRDWMEANAPYQKSPEKVAPESLAISYPSLFMIICVLISAIFYYKVAIKPTEQSGFAKANLENQAAYQVSNYQQAVDNSQKQVNLFIQELNK